MKATLISLIPPTLLTILVAATAALRFYDATDFPPTFPPNTFRQWSFWTFIATIGMAMVDFGLRGWIGYLAAIEGQRERNLQDRERELQAQERDQQNQERDRQNRERNRQAEIIKLQAQRDLAILAFLTNPTELDRTRLEAMYREIEQANLDSE
ncbi:hypothetical protein RIF25_08455 [Thermosynechococcaceae cyanobacterium BACA0444]|uniref:Uncharacterized protein n=1 Tax=Pseudocalidococcus azoricus BACA0444 TaxID=2918990 RepID=A0AAE4FST2_9CYAN|nr:hypothetical protein [Pseudocalidococcus azoricus]MDS3860844.1 hypothetical protein [Pseudocalidococcus azoricus BACA0444]